MTPLEKANAEQRAASDPNVSAFVAASAGTGKTKLLTDRLLRLMLGGARPERILCLTYTRAAAAEMTIRLNRRLGEWVAMPERELDGELRELDVVPTAQTRGQARQLFGTVLDLPGGMRIETIHAFCQSLLRRFPLEAELSPHFKLEDAMEAGGRLREARERTLAAPLHRRAIKALAGEMDEGAFGALLAELNAGDERLHDLLRDHGQEEIAALQYAALRAAQNPEEEYLRAAMSWPRETHLRAALDRIAAAGTPQGRAWAQACLDWLSGSPETRHRDWALWRDAHLKKDGGRRKVIPRLGTGLKSEHEALCEEIKCEHERIEEIQNALAAARLAALNAALLSVAVPVLRQDMEARSERAQLTYGDLIALTGKLLQDPGAAWVLYKLDGGIEHLLLDEAQDTAPAQWKIANAIAEEFFAGKGAVEAPRSIFAVGDAKQSIFSFQGADLRSFTANHAEFRKRVLGAKARWLDGELSVSFRSTAPILQLVDAVFTPCPAREGVVPPGGTLHHEVSRLGQAGHIALWPLAEPVAPPEPRSWAVPDDYASADSAKTVLARMIARHIRKLLDARHVLPSRGRPVRPGDVLILIRRRDELVSEITRELKKLAVPVAGTDRMVLTQAQAVNDLLALCDALLLPEDDLAFAQYLVSPLGDLSDESLMWLAAGRAGTLHAALTARQAEREDWAAAYSFFSILRSRADFVAPYALLMEALGPLGGRARLLRRLGQEAAEPIDELLAEALGFAAREPVSLQQFVFQLRQSGAEIKRETAAGGDMVRIMTVHGAKGLQAPLVILPDTTGKQNEPENLFWLHAPGGEAVPIYCPRKELRCEAVTAAIAAERQAQFEEYNRLLYVALTRAEDALIVCGARPGKTLPETCWYESVRHGFDRLGIEAAPDGIRSLAVAQTAAPDRAGTVAMAEKKAPMPAWAGGAPLWRAEPPPPETARPLPLAPSRNTEDEAARAVTASPLGENQGQPRQARAAALARGAMVHALLQHLPDLPEAGRRDAAKRFLEHAPDLNFAARAEISAAVLSILDDPALRPLFGPGSRAEVPIAGVVGDMEIGGLVDRLVVGTDEILLADYKTDRKPPAAVCAIPAAYLRQLAAYRALLRQIYPGHAVTCALIWTQTAAKMVVPEALLERHGPGTGNPPAMA